MTDTVETHVEINGETVFVGVCRYLPRGDAFALDPAHLPPRRGRFYFRSEKSGLPGALRRRDASRL